MKMEQQNIKRRGRGGGLRPREEEKAPMANEETGKEKNWERFRRQLK